LLLSDIRIVFDTFHLDRIWIEQLVEALLNMPDSQWLDWRGPNGDEQPHKLTTRELRRVLRSFGILAHTIWSRGSRRQRGASSNGYYRSDFKSVWARYCPPAADTQTHRHTPQLPKPRKRKSTVTRRRRSK